ncbi:FGGY-family carbohydrate kinase [Brucepastera parasyntrophica]|uniref:xylulokinase n=1 Tax=Brucepastera parasyntrophica TaxID=2880008 RepID=UPI00210E16B0|nr:FGGY-family carbohydrate kinase [Brucepastera parasyntrophica]ULQ60692.1 FGGY-family carbohydrate kinase [Brucepastera parasyntrophica]
MNRFVLAADIGTSSLKAGLIDSEGTIHASVRHRFPSAEDPASRARAWTKAFDQAWTSLCRRGGDISAIIISGNGPTLVSADSKGNPGKVLLWDDPVPESPSKVHSESLFIPRITAFRTLFPEAYTEARFLFSCPEYLIYSLTANAVTILPESRFRNAYWTDHDIEAAGIDPAKLPPFVPPGTVAGKTRSGIPVIAGAPDFFAALIGTGTILPGKACDRAGTSEGLNICTEQPVSHPSVRTLPSVLSGFWNASFLLPETGTLFHNYRKESGKEDLPYPEILKEILETPGHPGMAVIEKIGFSIRRGIEILQAVTGYTPVFTLAGGQAKNNLWNQLKADITGSVFALTRTPDAELMGDAIIGFTSLGDYGAIQEAADRLVKISRYFEPSPERLASYSRKYAQYDNLQNS